MTIALSGGGAGASSTISRSSRDWAHVSTLAPIVGGQNEVRALEIIGAKCARLDALVDGWRGPGSLAPSRSARAFYSAMVKILSPRFLLDSEPAPTSDGGMQLEWERGAMGYSAEITANGDLILNIFDNVDAENDIETIIEQPKPVQLAEFIAWGARAIGF